jgi:predicted metalloprotease
MAHSHVRRGFTALPLLAVLILLLGGAPPARAAATPPATLAPSEVSPFLDDVLGNVDAYWHETLAAAGRPAPSVRHDWVAPGGSVATGCGVSAGDNAAFYCPTDDTIYVGQAFAGALYNGVATGLPGQAAGFGRAAGDFAVSYVIAHEYAHNVQQEAGQLAGRQRALPTELNADCLAGTWAKWAFVKGRLDSADIQEGVDAAKAVGDFELLSAQHHGTPQQRSDALLKGYDSGSPSACNTYMNVMM